MKTHNELGDYLRRARERAGLTIEALAERLGVNRNTVGSYERGERLPDADYLARIAVELGADLEILQRLRYEAVPGSDELRASLKRILRARDAVAEALRRAVGLSEEETAALAARAYEEDLGPEQVLARLKAPAWRVEEPRAEYVYVPLLDVRARAGERGAVVESERVVDVLAFRDEWIRHELRARPEDLRLIYVEGDSMEPDLRAGDIILLDLTDTEARREGVYVVRLDGALLLKQVQRLPGHRLRLTSRNPAYAPIEVRLDDIAESGDLAIVGRVVWHAARY